MDLSGFKWPIIIAVVVALGWLFTSGGVNWMYAKFTAATPGVDVAQDTRDEAGLTKLASYTYHIWKWRPSINIIETSIKRYGPQAPNYWFNMERLSTCYERIGEYQTAVNIITEIMNADGHQYDNRVGNFDNLNLRVSKLKEMYEIK